MKWRIQASFFIYLLHICVILVSGLRDEEINQPMNQVMLQLKGLTREDILDASVSYLDTKGDPDAPAPSPLCSNHTSLMLQSLLQGETWAEKLFDSYGKPGSGLLDGNFMWFGSFDECNNVQPIVTTIQPDNSTHTVIPFQTHYCMVMFPLPLPKEWFNGQNPPASLGSCFPDTCSQMDITLTVNGILQTLNPNLTTTFVLCQDKHMTLDTPAIAAICTVAFIVFLVVLGTLVDIINVQRQSRRKEADDTNGITNPGYTPELRVSQYDLSKDYSNSVDPPKPGICTKLLVSFSVYTNGKKLLNTQQPAGSLRAVHGIRFISMSWVILGHTYFYSMGMLAYASTKMQEMSKRWTFDAISNATVSVDSFFLLSGLLVSYLSLKEMAKREGKMNWFLFYFHRYWRLTPPYLLVMFVYVTLFQYWGTGPMFPQMGIDNNCQDNFWLNILYVQNIVRNDKQCMVWAWYLANDMQFYILSPLIFVPFFYSPIYGCISSIVFLLATTITAGVISSHYHLSAGAAAILSAFSDDDAFTQKYYHVSWCRMGPYIIGLIVGYILFKTKCKIKMNKFLCFLGWLSAAGICLSVLFGTHWAMEGNTMSNDLAATYNALHRTAWGVGVGWVVLACVTGNGGFINTFLSWPGMVPLSRLTYCAYLVHPVVMTFFSQSRLTLGDFTDTNMIYLFFGNMVASYAVAFVVSLVFEAPPMGLEKALLHRDKK